MSNTVKLSNKQKEVVRLMRVQDYDIQFTKEHKIWQFEHAGRPQSQYLSANTAKSLSGSSLMELKYETDNKKCFQLSALGKTINL